MDRYDSLSHSQWECNYHVIFIPKRRRKVLYGTPRRHLGDLFRQWGASGRVGSKRGTCGRTTCTC